MTSTKDSENKSKRRKRRENREIAVILYIFLAAFLGMIIYLIMFVYKDGNTVINSSYNKRLNILSNHVYRGQILANDGSVLAYTDFSDDGTEKRVYPYANLFCHSVGYSSYGGLGIESMYAYNLLTSNDILSSRIKNDFSGNKNWGDNITTTLDPMITYAAYTSLGDRKGAVVVSEVKTGKILAIVSRPDFDPNTIETTWEYYNNDTESGTLLNRATQGLYPPGSTFKIVTALEYIRENSNVDDYTYNCKGSFSLEGMVINCYHGQNHGEVSFTSSFAKSCNSSFANITSGLNKTKFRNTCEGLLFNSSIPSPYSYKQSYVDISSKSKMEDLLQTGIGQGKTQITPYHMNLITCAIANNGVLMTPYVMDKIISYDGKTIDENFPKVYEKLLTVQESEKLTTLMEEVVLDGTAKKLRGIEKYTAAGKTGSAEFSTDKSQSHAWFTGFAPVDNPEIAVTVVVEGGGSGGETAVPIAKDVFDIYFNE